MTHGRPSLRGTSLIGAIVVVALLLVVLPAPAGVHWAPAASHGAPNPGQPLQPTPAQRIQSELSTTGWIAYSRAAQNPAALGAVLGPAAADPAASSVPVNAVRFLNDTSMLPQTETSVAVDRTDTSRVVAGFNDFRGFFCNPAFVGIGNASRCPSGYSKSITGFAISADGGATVLKSAEMPGINSSVTASLMYSYGDPKVISAPNGVFYFASLIIDPFNGSNGIELFVNTSNLWNPAVDCWTPFTSAWSNPCWTETIVAGNQGLGPASFEDKENLAVDWDPTSPYYGAVYVSWDHFPGNVTIQTNYARCTAALSCTILSGGGPEPVSGWANPYADWSNVAVAPNGTVFVSWCNLGTAVAFIPFNCSVAATAAGGAGYTPGGKLVVSFGGYLAPPAYQGYYPINFLSTEQFRTTTIPGITATANGVYWVAPVCTNAGFYSEFFGYPGGCGSSTVLFSSSATGSTWSLATPITNAQIIAQSWITSDPTNNNLIVYYYSSQFDLFNHRLDVMASVSSNGGSSWNNLRVTNVPVEPYDDPLIPIGFAPTFGDYFELTAQGGQFWTVFTGTYAAENGTLQLDPFLARGSEAGPLGATTGVKSTPTDAGLKVIFNATATNAVGPVTYAWNFGDGASATGATVNHTYGNASKYTASVTVSEAPWGSAQVSTAVTVYPALAVTTAVAPSSPRASEAVSFIGAATGGSGGATFLWTFGDGGTGTGASPTHTYSASGTYTVTLTVNDTVGGAAIATMTLVVAAAAASSLTTTTATEYTILALVAGLIVGALVMWAVMRRRGGGAAPKGSTTPPPWQGPPSGGVPPGTQGEPAWSEGPPPGSTQQPPGPGT